MNFLYNDYIQTQPSTGYETLIYDAMIGDAALFGQRRSRLARHAGRAGQLVERKCADDNLPRRQRRADGGRRTARPRRLRLARVVKVQPWTAVLNLAAYRF
jgi:hypothetical protein